MMEFKIETERLIIRRPAISNVEDYMSFCNSEFVMRYNAMSVKTRESVLRQFADGASRNNTYLLFHKEDNRVIGAVFTDEDSLRYGVNSLELSYFLDEYYARHGYMREALKKIIDYLFASLQLDCISARSFAPNVASQNLLLSLGFRENGRIPYCVKGYNDIVFDDVLYSYFPM